MYPSRGSLYFSFSPYWEKDAIAKTKVEKQKQRESGPSASKRKKLKKKR